MTREERIPREGQRMNPRELPLASFARSGVATLPTAVGHDVTLLERCLRDSAQAALADDVRDARPQAIGALFALLSGCGIQGDLRGFVGRLRVGLALAPIRQ
jgi:hypothetical protein